VENAIPFEGSRTYYPHKKILMVEIFLRKNLGILFKMLYEGKNPRGKFNP
jgi:hypothetical protein